MGIVENLNLENEKGKDSVELSLDGKDFWIVLETYGGCLHGYDRAQIRLSREDAKKLAIWLAEKLKAE